jgi:hypothetical protein
MMSTIHHLTNQYMIRSTLPGRLGTDEATFVEYGFARFTDSATQTIAADEPLVLLAAAHWTNHNYLSTYKLLCKEISNHEPSTNGFENYIAYCIAKAFAAGQHRIDQVFSFYGKTPPWARSRATLVGLHRTDIGAIEVCPVDISKPAGPTVSFGVNAKQVSETKDWLMHLSAAPICFPHAAMGPDILLVLRLETTGSLIWVAVQAKYSTEKSLRRGDLRHAIRSVTPSEFFVYKVSTTTFCVYTSLRPCSSL